MARRREESVPREKSKAASITNFQRQTARQTAILIIKNDPSKPLHVVEARQQQRPAAVL
jgi:hypothetical protein